MTKICIVLILVLIHSIAIGSDIATNASENAKKYLYLREKTNNNDAKEIDMFLKYIGLPPRLSWCAAFVVYNFKEVSTSNKIPLPKYGRVATIWSTAKNNPIRYKTFTSDQVRLGLVKLQQGDLPIWQSGKSTNGDFNGHIGHLLKQVDNSKIVTIEGNTLPEGVKGSQREGGGVYIRNRYIAPGTFKIIGFIRVQ